MMNKQIFLFALLVMGAFSVQAMEEKKPCFAISNEVISGNGTSMESLGDIGTIVKETIPQAASIIANHPTMLLHAPTIVKMGIGIAKNGDYKTKGIGNLVETLNDQLTASNYGTFTDQEKEIIMRFAVKPIAHHEVISVVKELPLPKFMASNHDVKEHLLYRKLMKDQHNVNPEYIFDGTITAPFFKELPQQTATENYHEKDSRWLIALERNPSAKYAATLRELGNRVGGTNSVIYFVSKKPELLKPFENNGLNIKPVTFTDAKQLKDFVQDTFPDLKRSENELD